MSAPLVSVCIATRDRAAWLAEALDSVFAQSLDDFEILVGDDASTDGTEAVLAARRGPRLGWMRHERPRGVAANRNALLGRARGRFVAWLDSDDRYLPEMLATQSARLESVPGAVLAHGGFEVIGSSGKRLPDWPAPFERDAVESGEAALRELAAANYVAAPTVMVRRAAHERAGPYREDLATGEDWELWLRLALQGDLVYTAEKLAQYRWHPGSLSRSAESSGRRFARELELLRGFFDGPGRGIEQAAAIERSGRSALAARAILAATDCRSRGARRAACARVLDAARASSDLARPVALSRLITAVLGRDDYRWHVRSRRFLARLAERFTSTRAGARLRRSIETSTEWDRTLAEVAGIVRAVTPRGAALAVVDKWDPTLLHLARRRGWHFPDRGLEPHGYPRDSATAIAHLAALVKRGASYLVIPWSGFWWLEHYSGLRAHLESASDEVWADERCRIFRLDPGARSRGPGRLAMGSSR